jgi:hypothetical protein
VRCYVDALSRLSAFPDIISKRLRYQLADMLLELRKTVRVLGVRLVSIRCEYGLWIGNVDLLMDFDSAFGGVKVCIYPLFLFFLLAVGRSVGFSGSRKQISLIQIPTHSMTTFQAYTHLDLQSS